MMTVSGRGQPGAWRRSSALKAPAASSGSAWQLVEKTSSVGRLGTYGLLGKSIWLYGYTLYMDYSI
jgi:hypothetical protein